MFINTCCELVDVISTFPSGITLSTCTLCQRLLRFRIIIFPLFYVQRFAILYLHLAMLCTEYNCFITKSALGIIRIL